MGKKGVSKSQRGSSSLCRALAYVEGLGGALSLENCFSDALKRPETFHTGLIILKTNIFSWTGPPGGRTELGETRTAGQQPRPPIPQAGIPHFVYGASWLSSSKSCRLLARSASALLLHCLLSQRT